MKWFFTMIGGTVVSIIALILFMLLLEGACKWTGLS